MSGFVFLVPARGGSRRLPGKNLLPVAGIPLVAGAVRRARLAASRIGGGPHLVVCSTDDPAIAAVARDWGADVVIDRPAELATDEATSAAVALHALAALEPLVQPRGLVLLQSTSPLLGVDDVVRAVRAFVDSGGRPAVAVSASHPATWHVVEADDGAALDVGAQGQARIPSGAIYIVDPVTLRETRQFMGPGAITVDVAPERSIDVDTAADLEVARALAAARTVRDMTLGDRTIGAGGSFILAEAGVNHDGRVDLAHRLVDAAADAGADAVKFQTFDPDALVAAGAPTAPYQQRSAGAPTDQRTMLAGLALPATAWPELRDHAAERGLVFLSSPFDDASADLLDALDVAAFKVGSGELTNLPFLERLAARGRPLLVSTGMADIREVADAIDAIAAAGDPPVALFHCVSSYPARAQDANLRAIGTLRAAFGVPVGWSDHTPGIELPIAAVALGATLIEKHLTLDRSATGPDHAASLEPEAFGAMVAAIRSTEAGLGTGDKKPVAAEREIAAVARRSLHWAADLPAGRAVAAHDLVALRPNTGLAPGRLAEIVGRRTARAVRRGSAVAADDVAAG